ncbi:MAG: integrase [Burkholderiales bacterium]|nr:MAG: integrase [Burkholderiales bacterium]
MSVYKPKGRDTYVIDFQCGGRRFCVSTTAKNRREADKLEVAERERAKRQIAAEHAAAAAFRGEAPLTLKAAADRYWNEAGQHHAGSDTTWTDLRRCMEHFGEGRRLDEISDIDLTAFVAWRRGQTVKGRKTLADGRPAPLVSAATVNRSTVDILRKLFTHARKKWKIALPSEPDWKAHRLEERGELVREIREGAQESDIHEALPAGYRDLWRFALASGLRLAECFLRWDQIDRIAGTITVTQKGDRAHVIPLTREMKAILAACAGHHDEWVFCYAARRTKKQGGKALIERGKRYPVTYSGMKSEWRRKVKTDLDLDLRFHDTRHTRATRLLRKTGNLKVVQRLLGHADIDTTARFYAHVTLDDVRAALEGDAQSRPKSRQKAKG